MIRLTLYGLSGKEKAAYDFEPDSLEKPLVLNQTPVFTVVRIVLESVDVQEKLGV